ncbi:MAG: hypothetical protein ACR2O4_13515, partial [Hyphomicrobiaceae bacterium]
MSNVAYTPEMAEFEEDRVEPVLESDIIDTSHPHEMDQGPAQAFAPEPSAAPLEAQPDAGYADEAYPVAAAPVAAVAAEVESNPERARPIPRISIQAFCEDQRTAEVIQSSAGDRRLAKTHVGVHLGGTQAALANFQDAPTPNLIIIESMQHRDGMLGELD